MLKCETSNPRVNDSASVLWCEILDKFNSFCEVKCDVNLYCMVLTPELKEKEVSLLFLWTSRDCWMKFDIFVHGCVVLRRRCWMKLDLIPIPNSFPPNNIALHCMLECFTFTIKEIHDWDFTTAPPTLHHHSQPPQHICIASHQKYHHLFHFHHLSRADWSYLGNVGKKKKKI